ncbi:MAG: hypothetical protein IT249_20795 [Chitinophagaceae bacterium]|nr:hypothetical protein [Chitinophagaceae bacterium]
MKVLLTLAVFLIMLCICSCKKDDNKDKHFPNPDCKSDEATTRTINNKKAVVRLTATYYESIYLVEENTIDTRLIPCNFPMEFFQDGLAVMISGDVKATQQKPSTPCCAENFVITKIRKE